MLSATDIRDMKDQEIRERVMELREELFRLRFRAAMMQLENPHVPGQVRREIARMKTVLREREIEAARAGDGAAGHQRSESP